MLQMPQTAQPNLIKPSWPAAILICLGVLCGCVSTPERDGLPMQDVPAFSDTGTSDRQAQWWQAFNDPALDARVDRALEANYDLAASWHRLTAARALARRSASERSITLDAEAGVSRNESSDSNDQTNWSLGLAASYEVDLWGRIDALAQAEALRAQATASDYQAVAISLSSSVSLVWYQLAQVLLQLELAQSQLETNQTALGLLQDRFDAGLIRNADVLRQQQLVEATREQAIVLRSRLKVLGHQLAVLEGRPPQTSNNVLPDAGLPALPQTPATGLPAELLERRPDVRAALQRLYAADEDLAAAVSNQYPRINLSASLRTAAEKPQDLFEDWLLGLAGQLSAPLIDGGQRRAEVERNQAVREQRLAEYGQVVLQAFAEVEDALVQEARQAERLTSLQQQLRLAEQAEDELLTQYLNGVADYLAVLTAIRDKQQLERDVITARLDLIGFRIALYRALAGGFETPREPVQEQEVDRE